MGVLSVPTKVKVLSIYQFGHVGKFLRFEVKKTARKILEMICDQLPEPTKQNTFHKNSHALIDLRDEFLAHEIYESTRKQFKGVFNLLIAIYDFDYYYWERLDWLIKRLREIDWVVNIRSWEEPRPQWWLKEPLENAEKAWAEELEVIRQEKVAQQPVSLQRCRRLKIIENLLLQNRIVPNVD